MDDAVITSRANPLIRDLARLRDRRGRTAAGRFLIEGRREVQRALAAGIAVETMLVLRGSGADPGSLLDRRSAAAPGVVVLGEGAFGALSRRQNPDGYLAVAVAPSHRLADLTPGPTPLLLVAEGVEKPGNLGAMMRSAEGAGADAVLVADDAADFENPNVIRASQGAVFSMATAAAASAEVAAYLTAEGIALYALAPGAASSLWDADLTVAVALAVGSEKDGLSATLLGAAQPLAIPMAGAADSLNASVAAAVALYEAVRQRRAGPRSSIASS